MKDFKLTDLNLLGKERRKERRKERWRYGVESGCLFMFTTIFVHSITSQLCLHNREEFLVINQYFKNYYHFLKKIAFEILFVVLVQT